MTVREYAVTLILASSVAAVVFAFAPTGKMKKYVDFLLSLLILLVILSPLPGLRDSSSPLSFPAPQTEGGSEAVLAASEDALRRQIAEEFGLPEEEILVSIVGQVTRDGEVTLTRVTVTLAGDSAARRDAVREYLKNEIRADCEVGVLCRKSGKE